MSPPSHLIITSKGLCYHSPLGEECFLWQHLTDLKETSFTFMEILQITAPYPIENPEQLTPTLGEPTFLSKLFDPQVSFEKMDKHRLLDALERLHHNIKEVIQRLHQIAPELKPSLRFSLAKLRSRLGAR